MFVDLPEEFEGYEVKKQESGDIALIKGEMQLYFFEEGYFNIYEVGENAIERAKSRVGPLNTAVRFLEQYWKE